MALRKNKFNNFHIWHKGRSMDSKAEARRYDELLLLEKAGKINNIERQPKFELVSKFEHYGQKIRAITYRPDFKYFDTVEGRMVVEDVKCPATAADDAYRLRAKLFRRRWGDHYEFREVIR